MKIIFDSEEQKQKFLFVVAPLLCPGDVGVDESSKYTCVSEELCEDCWRKAVEMEIYEQSE